MGDILVYGLKVAAVLVSGVLCAGGVVLSALSLSGTWLVLAAAALLGPTLARPFPGWWTIIVFLALCVGVECIEGLAAAWGVRSRGGSRWAGVVAVIGGFVGMALGTFIPIPIVGPLLGMLLGSFFGAYGVESRRMTRREDAVHVARGTVIARVLVILLKVTVTLGMTAYLGIGLLVS